MKEKYDAIRGNLRGMDLLEISRYLEHLRFILLCHKMAEEVDQPVGGPNEAVHHYLSAMSHIELAQHSMNLAHIHNTKRRES